MTSKVLQARAQVAVAYRNNDPARIADSRRNLAAEKLAQYIERVVAEAPPLTSEQKDRLAAILRGGDSE